MHGRSSAAAFTVALGAWLCVAHAPPALAQVDPVALVDPLVGTSNQVNTFPGASAPFGMLQWSPDTTSRPSGGGYEYGDSRITGFSLTHLSGPGCGAFGDVPILPIAAPMSASDLEKSSQPFAHADEAATPGYYAVTVGDVPIRAELTATTRAGIGRFTFPAGSTPGFIVRLDGSQAGVDGTTLDTSQPGILAGSVQSGHFCGSPDTYTLYFAAEFDRSPAEIATSEDRNGVVASFPTTKDAETIHIRVGISFVDQAHALANVRAEIPGWDFDAIRRQTEQRWRDALSRVAVDGGTQGDERVFYTALYHALLQPTTFSDADGSYLGFDGRRHQTAIGHVEYANYSGWDIYRSQIPLLALVYPHEASDMMRSLVDEASQGGWLPKWPLAAGYTDAMNGDSADPIIAEAYAFGARDFDVKQALRQMVAGASAVDPAPGQGWYEPRPQLDEYLDKGFIANTHANALSPLPNAASETLEYCTDDFAISRLAGALGDVQMQKKFARRARSWTNLYDSATGLISPRDADGAFFEPPMNPNGQSGFQEGNSVQYTWLIPFDERALFDAMGGDFTAAARLDDFFTQLDAGPGAPYAWLGNEPSLLQPWLYLTALEPWKTQALLRRIETTLYTDAPAGEAGNDDLGTMSAWYVWSALGIYPQTPGTPMLDIASPLFPHATLRSEDGRTLEIDAPNAADDAPYVQALRFDGRDATHAWFMMPDRGDTQLDFDLATTPNTAWGTMAGDGPPSFEFGAIHVPPTTTASLSISPASARASIGEPTTFTISASNASGTTPVDVRWRVDLPAGLHVDRASATDTVQPGKIDASTIQISADPSARSGFADIAIAGTSSDGAPIHRATMALQIVKPGDTPELAYVLNFSGASIQPIDLRSDTYGPAVTVGADPGDAAVTRDGSRLFVADQGSNTVSVVDTATLQTVATVPVGKVPAGLRLSPDGTSIWLSDWGDDDVRSIDIAALAVTAPIAVGKKPEELAFGKDGATLYVVDQGDDDVAVVDVASRKTVARIPVGRVPFGIVVSPDGARAYVTDMGESAVTPIDLARNGALPPIHVGVAPQQPAISPDGTLMYVPDSGSRTVTPIDLRTGTALPPIAVGNGPFYVTFSADGRTAYVAVSGDDDCVPIDVKTEKPQPPIPTGAFPIAVVR